MGRLRSYGALCAVFLVWGARVPSSRAEDPPAYSGLPQCLDLSFEGNPDYIPYEVHSDVQGFIVPLADEIHVTQNGKAVNGTSDQQDRILEAVFPSRHYGYVPPTGRITSQKDPKSGMVVWTFPDGTSFIHEVYRFSELLEIRLERMVAGQFRFGVYDPNGKGCPEGSFALRTEPIKKSLTVDVPKSKFGSVTISYRPLAPDSCLDCHSMEATSIQAIQPCAFEDPSNAPFSTMHADIRPWISQYEKRFGHSPLAPVSAKTHPESLNPVR